MTAFRLSILLTGDCYSRINHCSMSCFINTFQSCLSTACAGISFHPVFCTGRCSCDFSRIPCMNMRSFPRTTLTVIIKYNSNCICFFRHTIRRRQNILYRIGEIMGCSICKTPVQRSSGTSSIINIWCKIAYIRSFRNAKRNRSCLVVNFTNYIFFQNSVLQLIKIKACKGSFI